MFSKPPLTPACRRSSPRLPRRCLDLPRAFQPPKRIILTITGQSTARPRRSTKGSCAAFNEMYGLRYVALRYFNVYGPRMDVYGAYTEVLIRWMERLAAGQPPLIYGDGSQTMDFVHVHDIARANILAAKSAM